MGSRLFDEIREQRGLAYSVYSVDHAFADVPILQLSAGLESAKCVEAFTRMREIVDELRGDGPTRGRVRARARLRRRPPGAGVREHERGGAPRREPDGRLRRRTIDPDAAIAALDETTLERGRGGRGGDLRGALDRLRRPARRRRVLLGRSPTAAPPRRRAAPRRAAAGRPAPAARGPRRRPRARPPPPPGAGPPSRRARSARSRPSAPHAR